MIFHNLDISSSIRDWSYQQKIILHAVMGKMALIIYGEDGGRDTKNDYVKFALDVLSDYAQGKTATEAEADLTIANWSLTAYVKSIDKWIQDDKPCNNKNLYHSKASLLTVALGALDAIRFLRSDEVDSLLDGLQANREYDYFTSEKIFDYCNMLFVEGMRELQKIIPSQEAKQEKKANDDIDEYHLINESELIVRRTILWRLEKRVLLLAICGNISTIVSYEWPNFTPSRAFFHQITHLMELFCKGGIPKSVRSSANVCTILVDNLLLDIKNFASDVKCLKSKFDVAEMFENCLRVAVGCIEDLPNEYADFIANHIAFNDADHSYDSEELQMLTDRILDFAEGIATGIKD